MRITSKICRYCSAGLNKDSVGLNKKLFEADSKRGYYLCLSCMSECLECNIEDLKDKIAEFKAEGCKLFS